VFVGSTRLLPYGPWKTLADQDRYRFGVVVAYSLLGLLGGTNEERVVVASAIRHQRQCFVPNSTIHAFCLLLKLLSLSSTMTTRNENVKGD
jgi:hypothetical protein